jgi:single-strand DNA-binding protein
MNRLFSGTGNLGAAPALKHVEVDGEQRAVAEMRIFFDRRVKQDDGSFKDDGGFWLTASLWGWRAEAAAKLLAKGARVYARGRLREESWEDGDGQPRRELRLDAGYLAVDLLGLEQIKRRSKRAEPEGDED